MSFGDAMLTARRYLTFDPQFIDPGEPTGLWFCATAEDVQAAAINAVKLADGAAWEDLWRCEAFFGAFPYVFLAVARAQDREPMVERLRTILPRTVLYVPGRSSFRGCRSVAEFRAQYGMSKVQELLLDSVELPAYGLVDLADIAPLDLSRVPRVRSGIPELDRYTGGFYAGQLSLWTGERGLGKSTLLGQLLLEAVDQGAVACAYSGELDKRQFKHWVSVQAAGPSHVGVYEDRETGRKQTAISAMVQRRIDDWWRRKFFLYDISGASAHSADSILSIFDNARRCYGATIFLVDNLMTLGLRGGKDMDYFRAQSDFAGRLVAWAKQSGAHVHLVAHPRKADRDRRRGKLSADDVGGSGDLPNRADNVFALEREQIDLRGNLTQATVIHCLKNRMYGGEKRIAMLFDVKSKRFYRPSEKPDKVYGWERAGQQLTLNDMQTGGQNHASDSD